ncbi:DUF397 domain-containing protein [Kitasatospora sp. NPDC088548]|uniref:DUF397 domain-containing protein n=1 Tax=Kitasatospora sp. NPDC088548 TaxID=3364075 RepID=UPI003813E8D9
MSTEPTWFKSSHSGSEGGACVEVAVTPVIIHVRDSKDQTGPQLTFSPTAWADFIAFTAQHQQ